MKFRRKKYIIHKKYQFRLLGVLLGIVLAATLITTFVTHYFLLSSIVDFTAKYGHPPTGKELIYASFKPLIITVPIILFILCGVVIFISHKIAGPLYRLKMYMKKVGEGDFSVKLKFRNYDAIHDIADTFNEMVEKLRKMMK
ncbi:MAG TPA: HAMP domain-containing protein [candidate division WOR-3 bacterium]|uniref:HAMP domain-containing protein n=1 Tax=candidate division WOR-3 bacterium TaxID=2052148 RepID=A0A9C9ENW0_UNCW3|nr:HAMP domain-containing protein [candidate division WOR-3 bacterium]